MNGHATRSVVVELAGGLGNQLFQYAMARYLLAQGASVTALAIEGYGPGGRDDYGRRPHAFEFGDLPLVFQRGAFAGERVIEEDIERVVALALARHPAGRPDGGASCGPGRAAGAGLRLAGYWQKAWLAEAVAGDLVAALLAVGAAGKAARLDASVEACVHVRRGDYGHHGLLPMAYYRESLSACGWPRFAVVTDEPNFCRHEFARFPGFAGVVAGRADDPWGDLFVMACAPVRVISNSTFAWWAAWLGTRLQGGRTLMPSEWSLVGGLRSEDFLVPGWQTIDTRLVRP